MDKLLDSLSASQAILTKELPFVLLERGLQPKLKNC